jgi:hypothetical protein
MKRALSSGSWGVSVKIVIGKIRDDSGDRRRYKVHLRDFTLMLSYYRDEDKFIPSISIHLSYPIISSVRVQFFTLF